VNLGTSGITPPLTAFVNGTTDGSAADTGILTSASTVPANQHGLPINFGPGAELWTPEDALARLIVVPRSLNATLGAAPQAGVQVQVQSIASNNVQITIKNTSSQDIQSIAFMLIWAHSLVV